MKSGPKLLINLKNKIYSFYILTYSWGNIMILVIIKICFIFFYVPLQVKNDERTESFM